jgi:hypothetical protein
MFPGFGLIMLPAAPRVQDESEKNGKARESAIHLGGQFDDGLTTPIVLLATTK